MKKRVFSILLALCMVVGLVSVPALAAEDETATEPVVEVVETETTLGGVEESTDTAAADEEITPDEAPIADSANADSTENYIAPAALELSLDGDGEHKHCVCNGTASIGDHTTHNSAQEWTAWDGTTSLPPSGYYYLMGDVELSSTWLISGNVTLCLNGHSITGANGEAVIKVYGSGSLTITDCKGTGKITHKSGEKGAAVLVWNASSTFNFYGGNITGNIGVAEGSYTDYCGGVDNDGTFNMYGGKITGNTHPGGYGGGVNNDKTFNMYGGTIGGTTDAEKNTAGCGAGVYNSQYGRFTMSGGSITGNSASSGGGGVNNDCGTFNMSGGSITGNSAEEGGGVSSDNLGSQFTMSGNAVISGNSATEGGGGVCIGRNGTVFTMNGGSITGNTAKIGGGVYNRYGGAFNMNGGSVTGNSATVKGGGVCLNEDNDDTATMSLSGTVNISGNTVGETASNLCLVSTTEGVTVSNLTNTVQIGVSSVTAPTEEAPIIVTSAAADKTHFTADNSAYEIGESGGKTVLQVKGTTPTPHTHTWGNWTSNNNGTHTRSCTDTSCTATETENCSGGAATCTAKAICSVCGTEYGEKAAHNYTNTVGADYLKDNATCTANAVYYKSCSACGVKSTDQTFEAANTALGHTGGEPTCTVEAECTRCRTMYLDPNHHNSELTHVEYKAATKETEGNIEYWYCKDCKSCYKDEDGAQKISQADTVIAKITDEPKPEEKKDAAKQPPRTGDESNAALWSVLLLASAAAIGMTVITKKKRT